MSEKTIFSRIIDREIPAHRLYEDDLCIAILDVFPLCPGHTLIIPKDPIDYWYDVPAETYAHMMSIARRLSHALTTLYPECRIIQVVEGFEVSHTHLHLIPSVVGLKHLARPTDMADTLELTQVRDSILLALSHVSS